MSLKGLQRMVDMLDRHAEEREKPYKKEPAPAPVVQPSFTRPEKILEDHTKVDTTGFAKIQID